MNTNMSSANQINNGGNIVINKAALQLLIASKNEAQVAQFEAETGWTWQAACETSIETATANLLASKSAAEIADFEAATNWKWSDAVDESILAGIEANLRELSQSAENDTAESSSDKFERETGWTYGDAVDMAAELRREDRIFGTRH